jgi:hypothetical protein
MPLIRNKLNNRIFIQLKGGRSIDLLEKSTVKIGDDDLLSSHLQELIRKRIVIKEEGEEIEEEKTATKIEIEEEKTATEIEVEKEKTATEIEAEKEVKKEETVIEKEIESQSEKNSSKKKENNGKKF